MFSSDKLGHAELARRGALSSAQAWQISYASKVVKAGGVIAYPTEAVWGLGCDPYNQDAVHRILEIKGRPVEKGLILVISDLEQLGAFNDSLTVQEKDILSVRGAGPTTWLVPDWEDLIPSWVKGEHAKVAIRLISHPLVEALCRRLGFPLVSTSANLAGRKEKYSQLPLRLCMNQQVDWILPGEVGGASQPSTIKDLDTGEVIRK